MGLDTTHGAWRGAYSAFYRWRNKVAEAAGYAVWSVVEEVFPGPPEFVRRRDAVMCDWGHMRPENYMGDWSQNPQWKPKDPLLVLVQHSDCEGYLEPGDCAAIAKRLREVIPLLPDGDALGHIGNWRDKTAKFAEGCERAAAAGERLEFH